MAALAGRTAALEQEREGLGQTAAFTTKSAGQIARQVRENAADWRPTPREEPPAARQVLREIVAARITLDPTERDGARVYAYRGQFTFGGLFAGTICAQSLASPRGTAIDYQPVFQGIWRSDRRAGRAAAGQSGLKSSHLTEQPSTERLAASSLFCPC